MTRNQKSFIRKSWHLAACHGPVGGLREPVPTTLEQGSAIPYDFFVGTINGLLFHKVGGEMIRLTKHSTYGITVKDGRWYVFEKIQTRLKPTGRIISFVWDGAEMRKRRVELSLMDPEIHQIDWIGDELFVTDTRNNRLATYVQHKGRLVLNREAWPFGKLPDGTTSSNYAHLNSVHLGDDGKLRLLLHNQTLKTGKKSEVAVLNLDLTCASRKTVDAHSGHNILKQDEIELLCDSFGGRLLSNCHSVFKADRYLRGLTFHDNKLLVGGSKVAVGLKRGSPDSVGKIFFLIRRGERFQLKSEIGIKGYGNIYEVRKVGEEDYGMSNFSAKNL